MTRQLFPAILIGILAAEGAVFGQHRTGGEAPSGGSAVSSAPAPAPSSGGSTSSSGGGSTTSTFAANPTDRAHRRGDVSGGGRAVPRGPGGGSGSGGGVIEGSGFYPWGYAYGAGAIAGDGFYGGYYGAYDPWYGWFPTYAPSSFSDDNSGSIRLKVKPAEASVYVDGFYAGIVDDFDGPFQRLRLDQGPHRIEVRQLTYQPLSVDVMIQEDFTITYRGELAKQ